MTEKEIFEKVKPIIADKLGIDQDQIKMESNFINDLGADSLDNVELLMVFENEFKIKIPEGDQDKIVTVGDAINFVKEAIGK